MSVACMLGQVPMTMASISGSSMTALQSSTACGSRGGVLNAFMSKDPCISRDRWRPTHLGDAKLLGHRLGALHRAIADNVDGDSLDLLEFGDVLGTGVAPGPDDAHAESRSHRAGLDAEGPGCRTSNASALDKLPKMRHYHPSAPHLEQVCERTARGRDHLTKLAPAGAACEDTWTPPPAKPYPIPLTADAMRRTLGRPTAQSRRWSFVSMRDTLPRLGRSHMYNPQQASQKPQFPDQTNKNLPGSRVRARLRNMGEPRDHWDPGHPSCCQGRRPTHQKTGCPPDPQSRNNQFHGGPPPSGTPSASSELCRT